MSDDFRCGNVDVLGRILKGLEFDWSVREKDGMLIADAEIGRGATPVLAVVPRPDGKTWSLFGIAEPRGTLHHYKTDSFAEVMLFLANGPTAIERPAPPGFDARAALAAVLADRATD